MGGFFKIPPTQTWAKIGLDLRKFWKNCVILLQILPQIKQIGTLMGQYFLKTWYLLGIFYRSTFKVCGSTSLPKTKLEYPLGSLDGLFFIFQIPKL